MQKVQELFTIEEVAKWCGISRNAMYMHYKRGHINKVEDLKCWKIYFTREEVEVFMSKYVVI